ncbi:MAG: hypothetical protein PUD07_04465 [bacterium]|nr:hypothetical protein [bacterium]
MNNKKISDVLRKIELEKDLENLIEMNYTEDELYLYFLHNYSLEESLYLIRAYNLPIRLVMEDIKNYDNGKPYIDELLFVNELAIEYNTNIDTIIDRIKEVRRINKVINQDNELRKNR